MKQSFIPGFSYNEETDLLCALGHSVGFMKQLSEQNLQNKDYWLSRAESFEAIYVKMCNAIRDSQT